MRVAIAQPPTARSAGARGSGRKRLITGRKRSPSAAGKSCAQRSPLNHAKVSTAKALRQRSRGGTKAAQPTGASHFEEAGDLRRRHVTDDVIAEAAIGERIIRFGKTLGFRS